MCLKSGIIKQHLLKISCTKFKKIYDTVNGIHGKVNFWPRLLYGLVNIRISQQLLVNVLRSSLKNLTV